MLRCALTRASDWLLALAVLAAVLALLVPAHAIARRSDLVLAALVLFTALGIAPAQLATLGAHMLVFALLGNFLIACAGALLMWPTTARPNPADLPRIWALVNATTSSDLRTLAL